MPELPEVQTVVSTIRPKLVGRRILHVALARTDIVQPPGTDLPRLLDSRAFADVARRGKRIIVTLDNANRFFIHLGMTGRLTVCERGEPVLPHTHLTVELDESNRQLRFSDPRRFGGVFWLGTAESDEGMGPEPLSVKPRQLARLLSRTTRAIKNALLDQSVLAGLGNIYVDESLFAAAIHPLAPADTLSAEQIGRLNRAIKTTLRRALRHRGSTLRDYRDGDGNPGGFQRLHRVYGREGEPCRECRTKIERIVLGGRSTHFCPACQRN